MRCSRPKWMIRQIFRLFLLTILCVLIIVALITFLYAFLPILDTKYWKAVTFETPRKESARRSIHSNYLLPLSKATEHHIRIPQRNRSVSAPRKCGFHSCFNIYQCGKLGNDRLSVYVYPLRRIFVNGKQIQTHISKEFYQLIQTVIESPHFVSDPSQACIFVPMIDLLNLSPFLDKNSGVTMDDVFIALQGLNFWGEDGSNHILFSMFPNSDPLTSLSTAAILASSAFSTRTYRLGFHIPLLTFNPHGKQNISIDERPTRKIFCIAAQTSQFEDSFPEDVFLLDYCKDSNSDYSVRCRESVVYPYPEVLAMSDFCVVEDLAHPILWDAMSAGCIPVILPGPFRLPFDEVIDWRRNAIVLYEHQIPEIGSILRRVSANRKGRLKSQVRFTFERYFQSIPHLVSTVFEVVKERVFPHSVRTIQQWNHNAQNSHKVSPIFNPVIAPKFPGFTAVILAYERVLSLFQVIERVGRVPSLAKVIVVWNNEKIPPPPEVDWPKISKPIKVIQTSSNKMSNRFFPYDEIQTEAVFSVDDDIIMLTADEVDFAFHTWREFSDRLVGFPSRSHIWDNQTSRWKYESEWTNEISMVLTGAAFYHKFWHYAYFNEMSAEIRATVDERMNCEDIAMNFLIAHQTGKPPIKVTPRKKFKCPTCSNQEMLSADTSHMRERTDCINDFAKIYGYMPLMTVEFRADPVLYKVDTLPRKLKKFQDIGNL